MIIFDAEFNGLNPDRMHVFSAKVDDNKIFSTTEKEDVEEFFSRNLETGKYIAGHNIARFDIPVLAKLFDIGDPFCFKFVDTLFLSWYLFPNRSSHGLEDWGKDLGFPKVEISDWDSLSLEDYTRRCETDVQINYLLWKKCEAKLLELYGSSESALRCLDYLAFKAKCVMLANIRGWRLDLEKTERNLKELEGLYEEKVDELRPYFPVPTRKKNKPKDPFKKDGSLSVAGAKWFTELKEQGLPEDTEGPIDVPSGELANPGSHDQAKAYLFSLGWKPCTFKPGKNGDVPQLSDPDDKTKLVPSAYSLVDKHPEVELLAGLLTMKHRIGVLKSFLKSVDEEGRVHADIGGLANTLRLNHKAPLVNLPALGAPYGKYVRPCLVASEGKVLCGSDMSSLEDRTKQHYMWPYDPDYVRSMMQPDFDPHLDIALEAGDLTEKDVQDYKNGVRVDEIKPKRDKAKTTNYSSTYGAGPAKIASAAGMSLEDGERLHKAYWERNWSIEKIAADTTTKTLKSGGKNEMWLYNPVSKLWYSLRHPKDKFSTLNQGTGSFCFDTYLGFVLQEKQTLLGQFHDEFIFEVEPEEVDNFEKTCRKAIQKTNEYLKLNRELDIGFDSGNHYGEIH